MTGHGQLAAATQGEAPDRRHHRLAELLDAVEHALAADRPLPALHGTLPGQLADVGPGHERLLARSGQDHAPHRGVTAEGGERGVQLFHRAVVEGVELVGPVHGDGGHPVPTLDDDVLISHLCRSLRFSASSALIR